MVLQPLRQRLDIWREKLGPRAPGMLFALIVQLLLGWMLLTLGSISIPAKLREVVMMAVNVPAEQPKKAEKAPKSTTPAAAPRPSPRPTPAKAPPQPKTPVIPPPPIVVPSDIPAFDITPPAPAKAPAKPAGPVYGPPAPPPSADDADTPIVDGSGPNGEALYAASWYREPYPEELRGYLSTATSEGWAMIACRTVADFRVEDCIKVAESPAGSGIANAVLQAAWQFRVRPPRKGGQSMVGAWVRIRIDYSRSFEKRDRY